MAVTTDSLVYEWLGKNADDDGTPHANADGDVATWFANVGDLDITLSNFDWTTDDGWRGDGQAATPYALHNDGTAHVSRSTTATSAVWQDTSFSVEQWLNLEARNETQNAAYFHNYVTNTGFRLVGALAADTMILRWGHDASYTNYTVTAGLSYNAWHHVIITYDGTDLKWYWDNTAGAGATVAYTANTTAAVGPFFCQGTDANYAHGSIATVRWYSKALSVGEVSANYSAGILAASTDTEPTFTGLTVTRPVG